MKALTNEVFSELAKLESLPAIPMSEVAKHNTAGDAWIVIDGLVYDVTRFAALHPGGRQLLIAYAGKDASKDFNMLHPANTLQKAAYAKMRIGRLDIESDPKQAKALVSDLVRRRWRPFADLPFLDPRKTNYSPYYNDHHRAFQKKVRQFVQQEMAPLCDEWDEKGSYDLDLHKRAYAAGIFGAPYPVKNGGTPPEGGYDAFMDLIFWYELGRAGAGGLIASCFVTASIALPPVLAYGSPALQSIAEKVVRGEAIIALAVTEPWAGSDVASLRCNAVEDGDDFIVNGEKKFITSGMTAHYFTLAVRTDPAAGGHRGISLLLVDAKSSGITRTKIPTMGWWAGNTAYIIFENVRVPKSHLIGKINEGFRYVMENFNHERFLACVMATSMAHLCIGECLSYARQRVTFGRPLLEHQVIRHKLADMAMRSEAHWAWCEQLTYAMHQGAPPADIASRLALCKVNGTKLMEMCAREACQIFGGNSYARRGMGRLIERLYREVRVSAIGGGSEEIMWDLAMRASGL